MNCWPKHLDCLHRDYVGRGVSLNGRAAKVVLDGKGHALVAPLDPARGSVPFSWVTVFNVCDNRAGKFEGDLL